MCHILGLNKWDPNQFVIYLFLKDYQFVTKYASSLVKCMYTCASLCLYTHTSMQMLLRAMNVYMKKKEVSYMYFYLTKYNSKMVNDISHSDHHQKLRSLKSLYKSPNIPLDQGKRLRPGRRPQAKSSYTSFSPLEATTEYNLLALQQLRFPFVSLSNKKNIKIGN